MRTKNVAIAVLSLLFGTVSFVSAAADSSAAETPPPLPGGSDDVSVSPSTIVMGQDHVVSVVGHGFQDCQGTFSLQLRIDDTWRRSEPGNVLATGTALIGPSGDLVSQLEIDGAFDSNWTGYVTMEGGCLGSLRRVFGPVTLAFRADDPALSNGGISVPSDAYGAAGFLIPAGFIAQAFIPPDKPGATSQTEFDHLSAWVGQVKCATVDIAGGHAEKSGDAVVYVGLASQPAECRTDGAIVTFTAGREDWALVNQIVARPGILQAFRPVYPPPATSAEPPGVPAVGSAPRRVDGSGISLSLAGAVGCFAVAVALVAWPRRRR